MKTKLLTLACLLIVSVGAFGGFHVGEYWQRKLDEREAVRNEAAYWSPRTAEFVWGNLEVANLEKVDLNKVLGRPERKPSQ